MDLSRVGNDQTPKIEVRPAGRPNLLSLGLVGRRTGPDDKLNRYQNNIKYIVGQELN